MEKPAFMSGKPVVYTFFPADPSRLEVHATDGTIYEVEVKVSVVSVAQTDTTEPDGTPVFSLDAALSVRTKKKGAETPSPSAATDG